MRGLFFGMSNLIIVSKLVRNEVFIKQKNTNFENISVQLEFSFCRKQRNVLTQPKTTFQGYTTYFNFVDVMYSLRINHTKELLHRHNWTSTRCSKRKTKKQLHRTERKKKRKCLTIDRRQYQYASIRKQKKMRSSNGYI